MNLTLDDFIRSLQNGTLNVSETVIISGPKLNVEACERLTEALRTLNCPRGLKLKLPGNNYNVDFCQVLIAILRENVAITALDLGVLDPEQSSMLSVLLGRNRWIERKPELEAEICKLFDMRYSLILDQGRGSSAPRLKTLALHSISQDDKSTVHERPDNASAQMPIEIRDLIEKTCALDSLGITLLFNKTPNVFHLVDFFHVALKERLNTVKQLNKSSYFSQWGAFFLKPEAIGPHGVGKTLAFWDEFTRGDDPLKMLQVVLDEIQREPESKLSMLLKTTLVNYMVVKKNEITRHNQPDSPMINLNQDKIDTMQDPNMPNLFLKEMLVKTVSSHLGMAMLQTNWAHQVQNNAHLLNREYQRWCRDRVIDGHFHKFFINHEYEAIMHEHLSLQKNSGASNLPAGPTTVLAA